MYRHDTFHSMGGGGGFKIPYNNFAGFFFSMCSVKKIGSEENFNFLSYARFTPIHNVYVSCGLVCLGTAQNLIISVFWLGRVTYCNRAIFLFMLDTGLQFSSEIWEQAIRDGSVIMNLDPFLFTFLSILPYSHSNECKPGLVGIHLNALTHPPCSFIGNAFNLAYSSGEIEVLSYSKGPMTSSSLMYFQAVFGFFQ